MTPSPLSLRDADDATWAVYADALLSRGDVRGELIHLHLARRSVGLVSRERELLATHEQLGGPQRLLAGLDATWKRGFLSTVCSPSAAALRVLLTHASGELLDELVLDNPHLALDELVDAVGVSGHPGLRTLKIRTDGADLRFEREIGLGSVLGLPALRRIDAAVREVSFSSRRERVSTVEALEVSARSIPLAPLATWSFPALKSLSLAVFSSYVQRRWPLPADIPMEWPVLVLPSALIDGSMAPVLESISFESWSVDDAGAQQLVECLARQPKLMRVDLRQSRVAAEARVRLVMAGSRVSIS